MKKRINLITVAVLMALVGLTTFVITYWWVSESLSNQLDTYGRHRQELKAFFEALDFIDRLYVGEQDREAQAQGAVEGLVYGLGDKWAHFWPPEEYERFLTAQNNTFVGIGILPGDPQSDHILVHEVISNSPAEAAGLLAGDHITHVDGVAVADVGYSAAVGMIGGEEYTNVTLTIARPSEGGGSFTKEIPRRTVLRDVVTSRIFDGNIGYIKIANFNDRVDREFREHVENLLSAGVTGLIFDVRNNGGGSLSVLEQMLDLLLPEGDLVTLRYKDGRVDLRTSGPDCVELPMVVLINRDSVSAAELFAADLKEYDWAVLVGEHTGGKGYAQEHFRLTDGSGLYLSTSEYFTSKGVSLAHTGLTPDVEIELSDDERRHVGSMDPSLDRQLARALEILSGR